MKDRDHEYWAYIRCGYKIAEVAEWFDVSSEDVVAGIDRHASWLQKQIWEIQNRGRKDARKDSRIRQENSDPRPA